MWSRSMAHKPMNDESRTMAQLREHYEIERGLADRLRSAPKEDRRTLYSSLYDEMYRRVPLHPQLTRKASPVEMKQAVEAEMAFLRPFVGKDITFLEVGPGDCALSVEVAGFAKQVYAVDVSDAITGGPARPANFQLVLSDGSSVPVPPGSVDVAYSNQLMEHLHPDDAFDQLENVFRALAPGGIYVCITPNRLGGPHDVSKYFDHVATGFHLKEYTVGELRGLFRRAGFSTTRTYVGAKGRYVVLPAFVITSVETILRTLPFAPRAAIARSVPFRLLLGIRLVGTKASATPAKTTDESERRR
jgi:SAM-dependent methyltransferase